jgi:DNA-binding transcriptional LysR family regulator
MTTEPTRASFRLGFVPGVTLAKWSRLWEERRGDLPLDVVEVDGDEPLTAFDGDDPVVMLLGRLPLPTGDEFSVIPLYEERIVVVVHKEHPIAALGKEEEVALADLDGEHRHDLDPALSLAEAVAVVATGAGVAVMPQSLARLHGVKGTTHRFVADLGPTTIALVWPDGQLDDDIDDFIGVVRGRTANSSRSRRREDEPAPAKARKGSAPDPRGAGARKAPAKGRGGPQRGTGRSRPRRSR